MCTIKTHSKSNSIVKYGDILMEQIFFSRLLKNRESWSQDAQFVNKIELSQNQKILLGDRD